MNGKILIALTAVLLSACGDDSDIKDAVRAQLKDPDSAKFGQIKIYEKSDGLRACAEVNAKNSMGGYTGTKVIMLSKGAKGWFVMEMGIPLSFELCSVLGGKK
jgi:hypothetical protein